MATTGNSMQIIPIPAFRDNYIWAITQDSDHRCIIVDPGDAAPVEAFLQQSGRHLAAILITHHHADHCGGVKELTQNRALPVYGPASIDHITQPVQGGDQFTLPGFQGTWEVFAVPGHTLEHVAYSLSGEPNRLFCGDTLFAAGCGRVFEGTSAQMVTSLNTLAVLPDDTLVYCAHEYTAANLAYAQHVEPDNLAITARIAAVQALRDQGLPSLPSRLSDERLTNPFLRCDEANIIKHAQKIACKPLHSPIEVFTIIRDEKNHF